MNASTLSTTSFLPKKTPSSSSSSSTTTTNPSLRFPLHHQNRLQTLLKPLHASFSQRPPPQQQNTPINNTHPILQTLKSFTKTTLLIATTASLASRLSLPPLAKAEETQTLIEEEVMVEKEVEVKPEKTEPLSELLESNGEAIESIKSLLQMKLENGEDEEAWKLVQRLVHAQPSVTEWKFLMARLLSEMGRTEDARKVFDEILEANPLSFEALFENALLMDRCGEGEAVIKRLEEAVEMARGENKLKEERDVRLIIAQIQFLQRNVDDALRSYDELSKEDPRDFRPYFCRGMIHSLLDKNEEARAEFAKYKELSPKKFEVDGYLRTPLSRVKIFGTSEEK